MARLSPYRRGHFAPVREEVTAFDLPVTGIIPEDLDGVTCVTAPTRSVSSIRVFTTTSAPG